MASSPKLDPLLVKHFQMEPKKGDLKKLRIIEACVESLNRLGIEGLSLDALGKRLRMSRSQLLYYFPDRAHLLEGVVRFITITAQSYTVERLGHETNPDSQLRTFIEASFDWAEEYESHARVMALFYHFCTVNTAYRTLHSRIRDEGRGRMQLLIQSLRGKGAYSFSPEVAARLIQGLLTGLLIERFTTEATVMNAELKAESLSAAFKIINARE